MARAIELQGIVEASKDASGKPDKWKAAGMAFGMGYSSWDDTMELGALLGAQGAFDNDSYVDTYYIMLKEIITNADKRGEIDYDEVQDQMKAIYKRLKKAKKTNVEIFNEISEKVHKVSLQEDIYCQIVVAFFIAKCEVYDTITK